MIKIEIKLPKPNIKDNKNLNECIYHRKSVRNFQEQGIELVKISQILWAAQGIKNNHRTIPSAGATYPLELYLTYKKKGLFYFNFKKNILKQIIDIDISNILAKSALNQMFIYNAPINIIICADYSRTCIRYGNRGFRYVHIEVGHCAQNIHLEAVALDLGSVPIGAFKDEEVKKVLNLPENLTPLYIISIGYPMK